MENICIWKVTSIIEGPILDFHDYGRKCSLLMHGLVYTLIKHLLCGVIILLRVAAVSTCCWERWYISWFRHSHRHLVKRPLLRNQKFHTKWRLPSRELTCPPQRYVSVDDCPFPKVGYVRVAFQKLKRFGDILTWQPLKHPSTRRWPWILQQWPVGPMKKHHFDISVGWTSIIKCVWNL